MIHESKPIKNDEPTIWQEKERHQIRRIDGFNSDKTPKVPVSRETAQKFINADCPILVFVQSSNDVMRPTHSQQDTETGWYLVDTHEAFERVKREIEALPQAGTSKPTYDFYLPMGLINGN